MTEKTGTIELLLSELSKVFQALQTKLAKDNIRGLLAELGLRLPPELENKTAFVNSLDSTMTLVAKLPSLLNQLTTAIEAEDYSQITQAASEIIKLFRNLLSSFDNIGTELQNLGGAFPGINSTDITAFAQQLPARLAGDAFVSYLEGYYPILTSILSLLGIVEMDTVTGDSVDPVKPTYIKRMIHFDRIFDFLNPGEAFRSIYKWENAAFKADLLLQRLRDLLSSFALPVAYEPATGPGTFPTLTLFWLSVSPKTDISPPGLQADFTASFPADLKVTFPFLIDGWSLEFEAGADLEAGAKINITD